MKHLYTIISEQMICEAFVTLWKNDGDEDRMLELEGVCWPMMKNAYTYLATKECPTGILNTNSWKDLVDEADMIKVGKAGGRIVACQLYKIKGGNRKAFVGCCDGSADGKRIFTMIFKEDFKVAGRNGYIEVSGKAEHWLIDKLGFKEFCIPVDRVEGILGKEIIPSADGYHYQRMIGGEMHEKIMLGNI